jgi:N-(2-amino-2-carboxyethyl)-L-glutamate synthase
MAGVRLSAGATLPAGRPVTDMRGLAKWLAATADAQPPTPMVTVWAGVAGRSVPVRLKLESANSWGSIKDRTALSLAASVAGELGRPGAVLVESTSGNLGVALAAVALQVDRPFLAVVDPNLPPVLRQRLVDAGATLDLVTDSDEQGGYLGARLARVAQLVAEIPGAVWTDQYHNQANPLAHERWTAPELLRQAHDADVVFVAVSTGGTLAGVSHHIRQAARHIRLVGVDVPGSRVFGEPTGTRTLTGIGASRQSAFLRLGDWDEVVVVPDAAAIAVCHELRRSTGLFLGGSSGAVVAACMQYLARHPEALNPVCVCPDGGSSYADTLYNPEWLTYRGVSPDTDSLEISLRRERSRR